MNLKPTKRREWPIILKLFLERKIRVTPLYLSHDLNLLQYGRGMSDLRDLFGKENVENRVLGKTESGCKKTDFIFHRNSFTEAVLEELKKMGAIDQTYYFPSSYPRSNDGFIPQNFIPEPPKSHDGYASNSHRIAAENRARLTPQTGQLNFF